MFVSVYKEPWKNQFEKTLKFIFWGAYIFFFIMTFKGRVEGHWTLFAVIPGLYFTYRFLRGKHRLKITFERLAYIALVLVLCGRIIIIFDSEWSLLSDIRAEFHHKHEMLVIKQQAQGYPVAFMNSYQNAALYTFYSGSEGFSLNNIMGRKNQFDIWQIEDKYRGQKIMLIPNYHVKEFDTISGLASKRYTFIDNFQSFSKIKIELVDWPQSAKVSSVIDCKVLLHVRDNIALDANDKYPSYIYYQFFADNILVKESPSMKLTSNMLNNISDIKIVTPKEKGKYRLFITVRTGWLPPTINSGGYTIQIEDGM